MHPRASCAADAAFSGSYLPDDVIFLLQPIAQATIGVAEKERLIQSGQRHYSEMISWERAPPPELQAIFEDALEAGRDRMGREIAALARAILAQVAGPLTLASLVRAGVPPGILLTRALRALGADVEHFGISIIRDRGLDHAALASILRRRPIDGLVFVDGWTGKGAIAGELERDFTGTYGRPPRLVVLADPCGRAWLAASGDDWLIPSGILGSTVSGLISRSILNERTIAAGGFHGCVRWDHLVAADRSRDFIEAIWQDVRRHLDGASSATWTEEDRARRQASSARAIGWVAEAHGVANPNRIKPGIAEATRAVLRRAPERIFVAAPDAPDLRALAFLAREAGIPMDAPGTIAPYRAITLIGKVI